MKNYLKSYSEKLGRVMECNRYGTSGVALVSFPCEKGRFYDHEEFGLVDTIRPWIEAGKLQVFTVDSIDGEIWSAWDKHPYDRAQMQVRYDAYITDELLPMINQLTGHVFRKPITFGTSMGGYHAVNTFLRHPEKFSGCISLSGVSDLQDFIGDYHDEVVPQHVPVRYLGLEQDPAKLAAIRAGDIIICVGQGNHEETMRRDADSLQWLLESKGIPAWVDRWGHDVDHDWPWWRIQLPYFLSKLNLG